MTAAERLQAEKERLLTTTGFYVPPYRMANLMKAAAKIMDIIIKADTNICYEECRFIMAIVDAAIPRVSDQTSSKLPMTARTSTFSPSCVTICRSCTGETPFLG